jgi:pSer/pThr/pTyr-binding forkhead associated (FHA) protein
MIVIGDRGNDASKEPLAMQVKLRVMQGAQAGRDVIIPVAEFLIGRGEECHLRPRSDAISRRHCVIAVSDKQVVLRDMGSKNGSYVNGQRVDGSCTLEAGDHLQIGPLQFELVIEHTLGGAKRPAARDVKEIAARTAAPPSQDLDIARWLEEEEDTDTSRAVATPETRQFRLDDTANVMNMETSVEGAPGTSEEQEDETAEGDDASDEDEDEDEDGKKKRWKKNPKGKLPPRPSMQCKDSREAAADMLKRFFNRS